MSYHPNVDGGATPALDALLGVGWAAGENRLTISPEHPAPFQCDACPFCGPSYAPYEWISNDTSEAYYPCSLLNKDVWAEDPSCTIEQWRERARQELGEANI